MIILKSVFSLLNRTGRPAVTLFFAVLVLSADLSSGQPAWRPFNDDSPWNIPIGDRPLIDKNSNKYLAQSTTFYRQQTRQTNDCFISATRQNWGIALFFIDEIQPYPLHLFVSCHTNWGFPLSAPLPKWATPDPSEDAHLCIIDRREGIEWDFWNVKGHFPQFSCGSSVMVNTFGPGAITSGHGCRESGFPLSAGLIRPQELDSGEINHALVFGFDGRNGYDQFVYPAITGCDNGFGPGGDQVLPMGSRLQLVPETDLSRLTPAVRVIAKALQIYGMFLGDEGDGRSMSIYFQTVGEVNGDGIADDWKALWSGLWSEADRQSLAKLKAADFRVIELPTLGAGRPPLIAFSSPADTITTDKNVNFHIQQRAGAWPITQVQFFLDQSSYNQPSYTDTSAPYIWRLPVQRLTGGTHIINAIAIDQKGSRNWTSKKFYVTPR